ncbi:MAG TPA: hypothetical protein VH257_16210 [Chloroflexota bacterium]|nr:hypothetical protein [Chloroflexota bacterium]
MTDPGYLGAALLCTGGGILLYLWSLRRSGRRVGEELDELTRRGAEGMLAPPGGDERDVKGGAEHG